MTRRVRQYARGWRRPNEVSLYRTRKSRLSGNAMVYESTLHAAGYGGDRRIDGLWRRSPDRHGRGVGYSIALVERLSAFFIMFIGFEGVRPRLTPRTWATFTCGFFSAVVLAHLPLDR